MHAEGQSYFATSFKQATNMLAQNVLKCYFLELEHGLNLRDIADFKTLVFKRLRKWGLNLFILSHYVINLFYRILWLSLSHFSVHIPSTFARERSVIPFHRYKTEAQRDVVTYPEQQEALCNQAAECLKHKHPSPQTCCLAPEHN